MLPSIKKRRVEDGAVTGDNESATNHSENDVVMLSTDKTSSSTALTTSNNVESLCTLLNKKSTTITNLSNSLEAFLKVILEKDDLSESMPLLKKAMMLLSIYRSRIDMKAILKTLKHDKEGVVKLTVSNNVNTIHSYFSPMSGRTITIDTGFSLSRYAFLSILKFLPLNDVMKWMRVNKQMKSLIDSHEGGIIIAPDLSILPDKERMTMTLLKKRVLNRPFFQYVEAIELPRGRLHHKGIQKHINIITASLSQLTEIIWPKKGDFMDYYRFNSKQNIINGILEPENILVLPQFGLKRYYWWKSKYGVGDELEKNKIGMSSFENALHLSFSIPVTVSSLQLSFPSQLNNLVSLDIKCDSIESIRITHRFSRNCIVLKESHPDFHKNILKAAKNLRCLKDFRFPYSKNVFTETTTFEKIRNNHPCIERLEIYACKRLVSITYIK